MKKMFGNLLVRIVIWVLTVLPAAGICFGEPVNFSPEEIMYLTGVEMTAGREGARYSLYDADGDEVSELFFADDREAPGKAAVYRYDPETDAARMIFEAGNVTEIYGSLSRDGFLITDGSSYRQYTLAAGQPEEIAAVGDTEDGYGQFLKDLPDHWEPLLWVDGSQWADGSIFGVASRVGDPGPRNDFYLSSNYEWLKEYHGAFEGDIHSGINDLEMTAAANKEMMFADREKYDGEDIRRVRGFYDIAVDWERREAEGIEPVKKYLEAAESVQSLAGLTEYLTDPERNPFRYLLNMAVVLDETDTSHWALEITGDDFSVQTRIFHTGDREYIEAVRADFDIRARHVLLRAGYTEQETGKILSECYELEDILLPLAWPSEADAESPLNGFQPFDMVTASCERFPLKQLLNAYAVSGGQIHVYYPGYLMKLDELYTEENLSMLKSYFIAHIAEAACEYLDQAALFCLEDPSVPREDQLDLMERSYRDRALSYREIMGVAAENAYMTHFVDPEVRADLTALAEEIRDTFREMLRREDWLSDAGKAAAIEKLDNMTFSVMAPDTLIDSSYLAVDPEKSFLDNYARIKAGTMKHNGAFAGLPREKGDWRYDLRPEISSSITNGFYYGCFNQFFILAGFVPDEAYRPDMPLEEKLSGIGAIIGHELTHGFDPDGIRYDKNGNMAVTDDNPYGWMPEEDYKAFMERAGKIAVFFDRVRPFPYASCPGGTQWGEAAADIGGLAIGLEIAGKTDGFDYDRFFRSYSDLWKTQSTLTWERSDIYDSHPLRYLRVNVTVRQFDEFLRTYDVREGDGMYPDPEDRIRIW